MEKKNKISFKEFESFKGEAETLMVRWFIYGDSMFLFLTLILMIVAEEIFKLGIVKWSNYWILFFGNILIFAFFIFSVRKNFKVWLLKYVLGLYMPLLVCGWAYSTDPRYVKPILIMAVASSSIFGLLFYDMKVLIISNITTALCVFGLFFHYFNINAQISFYEIYLVYLFLFLFGLMNAFLLQRSKIYLSELLEKRTELQEAKSILEVKVKARTKELQELAKTLDQQIKERTKELQKRVDELEKFHKVTVGRELKMAELKKEIEKLKEENIEFKTALKRKKKD